jgi:hypothetical protein
VPRPIWEPATFDQAAADVIAGAVGETHYVELKRDPYPTTPGGRKEAAKDIAGLAVDGGVLVLGVEEDKASGKATAVTPVPLAGKAEWFDQVTHAHIDPPVMVETRELGDPVDPTKAVIIISVPASPLSPHMVDGRYYGRDDRSRRALTDAEVGRLHRERDHAATHIGPVLQQATEDLEALLPHGINESGRVIIVAEPVPLRQQHLLRQQLADPEWWRWLQDRVDAATERIRYEAVQTPALADLFSSYWTPFRSGSRTTQRLGSRGVAFRIKPLRDDEATDPKAPYTASLEVEESGAIRLWFNEIVFQERDRRGFDWRQLLCALLFALGLFNDIRTNAGARYAAAIGLRVEGLAGTHPRYEQVPGTSGPQAGDFRTEPYPDGEYVGITEVTRTELDRNLANALDRLCGSLLRGYGLGDPLRPSQR